MSKALWRSVLPIRGRRMKAYVYDIAISESVMDMMHGFTHDIRELWVPKEGIVANLGGQQGQIFVFKDYGERMKQGRNVKVVPITPKFATMLVHALRNKELEEELKEVLA
jgi:hypothetical protein